MATEKRICWVHSHAECGYALRVGLDVALHMRGLQSIGDLNDSGDYGVLMTNAMIDAAIGGGGMGGSGAAADIPPMAVATPFESNDIYFGTADNGILSKRTEVPNTRSFPDRKKFNLEKRLFLLSFGIGTRTRGNSIPYDTEANAAG